VRPGVVGAPSPSGREESLGGVTASANPATLSGFRHAELGNQIPDRVAMGRPATPRTALIGQLTVAREQFLDGLLNSYSNRAA
jgi:hypothetical protein